MRPGIAALWVFLTLWAWAASLPPRPGPNTFLADQGGVLSPQVKSSLSQQLEEQNRSSNSDLFVITVPSLKSCGQTDLRGAAQACFPAWKMKNSDILLLLSVQDHKARIQLGKGWGPRWDLEMQRIMRDVIVPACQVEDYNRALTEGAKRLLVVTTSGPEASLPAQNWYEKAENLGSDISLRNELPWQVSLAILVAAYLLLLLSLFSVGAENKKVAGMLGLILAYISRPGTGGIAFVWLFVGFSVIWTFSYLRQVGFDQSAARLSGSDPDREDESLQRPNSNESTESSSRQSSEGNWGGGSSSSPDGGGATGSW